MKMKLLCALCCAVLGLAGTARALGPEPEGLYAGIDVSEYQESVDFAAARAAGIQVVYIRAGAGDDYTDPYFAANIAGARAAGLRYGCYWYVTARTAAEARRQAERFASLLAGTDCGCRPAMDYEAFDGLAKTQINAVAAAFLAELERETGETPLLYSDAWAADAVWDPALGAYPLWAANWDASEPEIGSGIWSGWAGFQYSDAGSVDGVSGRVDLDQFTSAVFLPDAGSPRGADAGYIEYTVAAGDCLWDIAREYGVTVSAIVAANDIAVPGLIFPGQVFRIPLAGVGTGR